MSGTASRYIGGVPYGPGMGVGRYPNAASLMADFTPTLQATSVRPITDGSGQAVNPLAGLVQEVPMNVGNMLLSAALSLAPDAGNIYNVAEGLLTPPPITSGQFAPGAALPEGRAFITGPGGQRVPLPAGATMGIDGIVELPDGGFLDGTSWLDRPGASSPLPAAPLDVPAAPAGSPQAPVSPGGGLSPAGMVDDPLYGSLGETPFLGGDLATQAGGLAGGTIGGLISAQAFRNSDRPYAAMGQQAGSALGGIGAGALMGSAFGPIGTFFGALGGALAGGMAGGAAGGAIGPRPTIGGNFSGTGTFGADGSLSFGGFGGDNGGTAAEAQGFANAFRDNLLATAAAQGLRFNPSMAGLQFNIGGFDNPTRGGVAPGGFFYDPYRTGSPENMALRPGGDQDAYSADQFSTFTNAVLADLAARDVFTPTGTGRDLNFFQQTVGAPLGFYGANGVGGLSDVGFATQPGGFGGMLAQRQGEIGGWQAGAEQRAAENAARWNAWNEATFGAPAPVAVASVE